MDSADLIDQPIGNYLITEHLESASSGELYLAEHPDINTRVMVKVLRPDLVADAEKVRRLLDEASAANRVPHPGVVRVLDYGMEGGVGVYLVSELPDGDSLADRLEQGRLPVSIAVRVLRQTAAVMAAAHEAGVVHRDLRPANIHLVPDPEVSGGERVKVGGFAVAKVADEEGSCGATRTGAVLGSSPEYMSPEQCLDAKHVDARTDVYSLGVVAFQALSGQLPYEAANLSEMVVKHSSEKPPGLLTLAPSLPMALDGVVQRALAKVREQRWQNMDELSSALEGALPGTGGAPLSSVPTATGPGSAIDLPVVPEGVVAKPRHDFTNSPEPEAEPAPVSPWGNAATAEPVPLPPPPVPEAAPAEQGMRSTAVLDDPSELDPPAEAAPAPAAWPAPPPKANMQETKILEGEEVAAETGAPRQTAILDEGLVEEPAAEPGPAPAPAWPAPPAGDDMAGTSILDEGVEALVEQPDEDMGSTSILDGGVESLVEPDDDTDEERDTCEVAPVDIAALAEAGDEGDTREMAAVDLPDIAGATPEAGGDGTPEGDSEKKADPT